MNYIKHLTGFFEKVILDKQLNPTHISLYIALFQFWNCNRFRNPISISRDEVMRISKISSKATYHKCLKALHASGYIKYEPSFNPFKGSHVILFNFAEELKPLSKAEKNTTPNFEPIPKQVADKLQTSSQTSSEQLTEQAVVPYINNTNISNNQNNSNGLNSDEPTKNFQESSRPFKDDADAFKEKKLRQKKKDDDHEYFSEGDLKNPSQTNIPSLEDVNHYFREKEYPESEATKFFNYNNSIGWVIGGKSPITNWKAAANNWVINAPKFSNHEPPRQPDRTRQLDNAPDKNYAEPL